jgi:putative FmdB family regulatory protein
MTYEYECPECHHKFEAQLPMSESDTPQECPECQAIGEKIISGGSGFILAGDGWFSKNNRVKDQMRQKNRRLDAKQNERKREAPPVTLTPNVDGESTESWADAQKLAKSKGKDSSSYEPKVQEERAGNL